MAGTELIHHGEPEEGQRRGGFQRPGLHQIFQQRTGNQTTFFLAMLAQVEALQLGSDGAFQRVEGEVRIAVLAFAQVSQAQATARRYKAARNTGGRGVFIRCPPR